MSKVTIVLLVILAVLIIASIALYFFGKKAEKKQAAQQEQLDAAAQTVSMLIIDKGKMRLRDAGFPQIVIDNTPKYLRQSTGCQGKGWSKSDDPDVRCTDLPFDSCKKGSKSHRQRYLHYECQRITWTS